jgi:Superfamily II helicase
MIIDKIADDVLVNDYFNKLYFKANKQLAHRIFRVENTYEDKFTEKELLDLLRFSDLLSNSSNSIARNKSYHIITLLNTSFKNDPYYKTVAHSTLVKIGNFPGLDFLIEKDNNNSKLPFDREVEKEFKMHIQNVPDASGLYFTDSQYQLYKKIRVAKTYSFSGPTSMGKSFIIKSFIREAIKNTPPENIVIIVPTRALINQFSIDLNKELKSAFAEYNYSVVTNSNIGETTTIKNNNFVLVLTPERLLSYISQKENPPIGYLFIDEAHKIANEKDLRSITSYNAISATLKKYPNINLYFSSPNVTNPQVFLELFNKDVSQCFHTVEAPVSQNLFYLDLVEKRIAHVIDDKIHDVNNSALQDLNDANDLIALIGRGENNIVYCSSRHDAVNKAMELYNTINEYPFEIPEKVRKAIAHIKSYIHKDYYLAEFLSKGIAYHFGNLPQIIRNKVEEIFKESNVNYVFCTSTLLEGVNLPAKNVFIIKDKNGRNKLQPIDFWNLAGRAGRLKYELSGNIFCIREDAADWKKHDTLFDKSKGIVLKPTIETYIDSKLKAIEKLINDEPLQKEAGYLKAILAYIANIIRIDTMEIDGATYNSVIIKKLIEENRNEIIELARKRNENLNVPISVLNSNQSINLKVQDDLFKELVKRKQTEPIKLPNIINYEACLTWLNAFYRYYKWETEEKSHFKSVDQLKYYATLMNQWINGQPLSQIISQSITYNHEKSKQIKIGFTPNEREVFNRNNKLHVNILIGNIIDDIEKVLRFILEKYFNNYYAMLLEIYGEDNAGSNWSTFLEYGTQNSTVISLQNLGLSRHTANFLYTNYKHHIVIENDKLKSINSTAIMLSMDKDSIEFDEVQKLLG